MFKILKNPPKINQLTPVKKFENGIKTIILDVRDPKKRQ